MGDGLAPAMQGKVQNAVVADPVQSALNALVSGKDVEAEVYGQSATPSPNADPSKPKKAFTEDFMESDSEEGSGTEEEGSGSGTPDSEDSPPSSTLDEIVDGSKETKAKAADVEEIIISDDNGRKKVTVDWNNRDQLKKYVQMAAGMRKFQAERDKAISQLKEVDSLKKEHQDYKSSWSALENAFNDDGIPGVINLLVGKSDAYQKHLENEMSKRQMRENASPLELEKLEWEEKFNRESRERQKLAKQVEGQLKTSKEAEDRAAQKSLESQIYPAFDKYRFAGKLGDSIVESRLDKAIWAQAREDLLSLPDNAEITPSVVDKVFKDVAQTFKRTINQQAEAKTKQVIQQKKIAAGESAAIKAMSGIKGSNARDEFKEDMRKGDLTSALRSVLTGKFKF